MGCVRVCAGVCGYARGGAGVCGYAWVYTCVWDELSEFLPENRVPTSADFDTYPIRIFLVTHLQSNSLTLLEVDRGVIDPVFLVLRV